MEWRLLATRRLSALSLLLSVGFVVLWISEFDYMTDHYWLYQMDGRLILSRYMSWRVRVPFLPAAARVVLAA